MNTLPSRLYAICDADACARAGWALVDFAAACLDGGATLLQVRAKSMGSGAFLDATQMIVERARSARATVIVNDRADIALIAGAAGVHIGQDDLPTAACRAVLGAGALIGRSTHTAEQIAAAVAEPISYLAIGPVYGTASKDTGFDPVGLEGVRDARRHAAALPLVAIGGITLERARVGIEAGADAVAVIGDLVVPDPTDRVRQFLARLA